MVVLPIEFVKTRYPGYFWNTESQTLYSLKIGGVLKEIKISRPNSFNNYSEPMYRVCVKGVRKGMSLSSLQKLTSSVWVDVFPVKGRYGR